MENIIGVDQLTIHQIVFFESSSAANSIYYKDRMSNFFRDSSLGFKPRSNIFSKLRTEKEPNQHTQNEEILLSEEEEEEDSSMIHQILMEGSKKQNDYHTSLSTNGTTLNDYNEGEKVTSMDGSTPLMRKIGVDSHVKKSKESNDDTEDFEITEVRNVSTPSKGREKTFFGNEVENKSDKIEKDKVPSAPSNNGDSSNDVLLEAFTNTQRICATLKQELQTQQLENKKLKMQIRNFEVDSGKIHTKVEKYHQLLKALQEKLKILLSERDKNSQDCAELKKTYETFQEKITCYRNAISDMKGSISNLKSLKKDTELELMKKEKEIEYLKREVDDTSGQLSEEKIKNCSLLQEFTKTRETLKENFESQKEDLKEKTTSMENCLRTLFKDEMTKQLTEIEKISNQNFEAYLEENSKRYLISLRKNTLFNMSGFDVIYY